MRDIQKQEWEGNLKKSRYAENLKEIIGNGDGIYKKQNIQRTKDVLETVARFRMGSETISSKFWKRDEEKKCRLCNEGEENIRHVLMECIHTEGGKDWMEQIKDEKRAIAKMKGIKK